MYFRADKRNFDVGDTIFSAGEFTNLNPAGSQDVEHIFESARPLDKPSRIGSLFLFKDEMAAKKHWSKMSDGNLYLADIEDGIAAFEGDMRLIDEAFLHRSDAAEVWAIAIRYWSGELTENPVVEVLVSSATIVSVISKDQDERRAFFKSWALVRS